VNRNTAIGLVLLVVLLGLFAAGCANQLYAGAGANSKNVCNSTYCYCARCDIGNWTIVNKSKATNHYKNIVTEGDCAEYCTRYNISKENRIYDKGYDAVCSDAVALLPQKCNCGAGTRCCQTEAALAANKMQCVDSNNDLVVCPYAWAPDSLCNSTY